MGCSCGAVEGAGHLPTFSHPPYTDAQLKLKSNEKGEINLQGQDEECSSQPFEALLAKRRSEKREFVCFTGPGREPRNYAKWGDGDGHDEDDDGDDDDVDVDGDDAGNGHGDGSV
ncbi:hypothetical protein AK812_SmicGene14392 [Symbiodinium microadriaticum]|uniref:Uncharacterized protein n=1 Tax=Symbiodinium microadriaticum TaxID=2951 RepID=A0A1Q9E5L4_SYMMI|nr:hypothetical protein AK812_SmicGene14392 [Symbiodinium microadriaticum]